MDTELLNGAARSASDQCIDTEDTIMVELPGPEILTARTLVERVMGGETVIIPLAQFGQFLFEADEDRLEFCMKTEQRGTQVAFTKWDLDEKFILH